MTTNLIRLAAMAMIAMLFAGCTPSFDGGDSDADGWSAQISDTSSFGSGPEEVWLQKAKASYRNGDYGLAERHYRQAIEERHDNAEAWLGLAASYDRLKRFDHASRAYDALIKITGHTPTVLNNLAYHQMLKGDYASARQTLHAAAAQSPDNPYIKNNIMLLDEWEAKGRGSRAG